MPTLSTEQKAVLALIVANIIWGAASPIFKFALQNIPPFSLAYLRFFIACCLVYPFVYKKLDIGVLKNIDVWIFSLTGITANILFFFLALQRTASINAPIIGSSGPVFILIFSFLFLHEPVTVRSVIGTITAFIGILVVVFQPLWEGGLATEVVGNLLLVAATLSAVISIVHGKKLLKRDNVLPLTFWMFFIGFLSFAPLAFGELLLAPDWLIRVDYRGLIGIIFGGFLSSTAAYLLENWSIARLPAVRVAVFQYLDPVAAILLAIPLLGERLTGLYLTGSVLVFLGILIAEHRLHYHPLHRLFSRRFNHEVRPDF
jgi:drug/metabolite transporter (DMT)-like permease